MSSFALPRPIVVLAIAAGLFANETTVADDVIDLFRPKSEFELGPDLLDPPGAGSDIAKAEFTATLSSDDPKPGGEAVLTVEVKLPRGHYIYSTTPGLPSATTITVAPTGLEPLADAWTADRAPKAEKQQNLEGKLEDVEKFYGDVTWTQRYRIAEDASGAVSAALVLKGQYCGNKQCIPIFGEKMSATLAVAGAPAVQPVFAHEERPTFAKQPYPALLRATLEPPNAKVGEEVTLSLAFTVDSPWHVFSPTSGMGTTPTTTTFDLDADDEDEHDGLRGLEPLDDGYTADREAHVETVDDEIWGVQQHEYFEQEVTFSRRFKVTDAAYGLSGKTRFAVCKDGTCKPPVSVTYVLGHTTTSTVPNRTKPPAPEPGTAKPDEPAVTAKGPPAADDTDPRSGGLFLFLVAAAGAGFFALLTPCVFPMVPITVSFFLKQSEEKHSSPLALATVYALGIIGTFTILGVAMAAVYGATGVTALANSWWLNLTLAAVLIFFGASLLGMFEIRMPSWIVNLSSGQQSRGGYIGALFMAITFTLMSFTCTFAFAGLLLVWAAKGEYFWPILGMLSFSTAFALPFFVLALLPGLLKKMPQSGGWMNTIKVTMGMIEIGAALKFLSIADYALHPEPWFFDYHVVMCGWMVVAACTGAYLLGAFRLGHDTPTESISVPRLGFAMLFLCTASYLAITLFSPNKPRGPVAEVLAGLAPPDLHGGESKELGPYLEHDGLKYALDVDKAIEYAQAENKPLFFDFTGVNCANCRDMEAKMARPENRQLLTEFVRVQLFLDAVPKIKDPAERQRILDRNTAIAVDDLGLAGMPTYAIVRPNGEIIREVKPVGVETYDGEFTDFLRRGLETWERIAAVEGATRVAARP